MERVKKFICPLLLIKNEVICPLSPKDASFKWGYWQAYGTPCLKNCSYFWFSFQVTCIKMLACETTFQANEFYLSLS